MERESWAQQSASALDNQSMFAERKASWGWTMGGPDQLVQAFGISFTVQCLPWLRTARDGSYEATCKQHRADLQRLGEGIRARPQNSSLPGLVTGWPHSALSKAVATTKATVPPTHTHG